MRYKRLLLVGVAGLFLTGCGATKISRILNEPTRYQNRSVRISGNVTDTSFGIPLVGGLYQVQDDTGKLYVITNRGGVPQKGARVNVSGTVTSGVTFGGRSYGTVMRERDMRVR
ncbi:MAG: hypothetical protein SFV54_08830 [Bryobacteraceae bacterium]|nr:hypothetical protein [Bryobacteraceae bacterium]